VNKNLPFLKRLAFALNGLRVSWRGESSFRTHVVLGFLVAILTALTQPAPVWWGLLAIVIGFVMCAELFNTALERLADRVQPEFDEEIKIIKDVAAGAVLVASITGVAVAVAFAADYFR